MFIDLRFWSKFWLIKLQEIEGDKQKGFGEMGSPSLTPHSLEDSSIESHHLGVVGS